MTINQPAEGMALAQAPGRAGTSIGSRILRGVALAAIVCWFAGCGEHDLPPGITKKAVKFEDVPANVRAAATKAIPRIDFNEAWQNLDSTGKLHSYEIRGKNSANGKIREVRVSLTGEVLEQE